MFSRNKEDIKVHFVGIGGIGMSGIAQILKQLGYHVSGSDIKDGPTIKKLAELGVEIFIGHKMENIGDPTVIVYSSAINEENPEIITARARKIPLIRRAEMLAELMRLKFSLAIAGTHGKTTTTSFLGTILYEAKYDPTLIIGGVVENLGGNARVGQGDLLVAEADESDGSFLLLRPIMCAVTNIDDDHLDYHKNHENLINSFADFVNSIPFYGVCALNVQDQYFEELRKMVKRPWVSYGLEDRKPAGTELKYAAKNIQYAQTGTSYDLCFDGQVVIRISIQTKGEHNVLNSLAAISLAHQVGLSFEQIQKSIVKFHGVGRRFEELYKSKDFSIVDDYAHHPTEILATLKAAKEIFKRKVVVVFEPHRYSRTQSCWEAFLHCFNFADEVYMTPIYPASEKEISGVSSSRLVQDINKLHPGLARHLDSLDDLAQVVSDFQKDDVILLTMGAGGIGKKIREVVKKLPKA